MSFNVTDTKNYKKNIGVCGLKTGSVGVGRQTRFVEDWEQERKVVKI